jgi:hypothetical protein
MTTVGNITQLTHDQPHLPNRIAAIPPVRSEPLFDLVAYLNDQRDWSSKTFGLGPRLRGNVEHIAKELAEVTAACTPQEALEEWCDIAILALDGAWRAGFTPAEVCEQLRRKQAVNFRRQWPPPGPQDRATEHIRSNPAGEGASVASPSPTPVAAIRAAINMLCDGQAASERVIAALKILRSATIPPHIHSADNALTPPTHPHP